jgi:hypothetical protein
MGALHKAKRQHDPARSACAHTPRGNAIAAEDGGFGAVSSCCLDRLFGDGTQHLPLRSVWL